ncbi:MULTISPECIES: Cu(+)/Ag(+) sensor histidine kinase [Edwardsiella]|uniref:Sensor protein n=2 Tax=Edwardsiella anguillarum TaxID=1821960 RepID=A0A076LQ73_9GAMM|nr:MULTISPECIES: Cu(+)/Ag(+) sensor histidine kinase [Edwardsiella]AIJ10121.1 Osmosensitive K+ channel histidine kinase KdpD [Edwardsiella anguillarum ET080813]KAB0592192.1 heavy metal sensor histidine kinase [Edwardsiella anguillarum]UBU95016.1 Cu(+)/Ag(+) sensor histidine kinase [Edwardsiella sp. LADL05-105]UOU77370.1 Cu(+)/Ag(+) sensor histidine kinase [Edwardsiella anguillarum]WHP81879.1 Cu(+)/Ag(+) sensor histidine kinase [Edwardsiella anguillarum]
MWAKRVRRPISLAARLTLTISLATSLAFVAFTWIMIYSVERHFAELDNGTLQQVRSSVLRVLQEPPRPGIQRLDTLSRVLAGYPNISVALRAGDRHFLYRYRAEAAADLDAVWQLPELQRYLQSGQVFLWPDGRHADGPREATDRNAYRLIASTVYPAGDPRTPYTLLIALSINVHLHYLEQLKANLMLCAALISLLIIFIVLLAIYSGHRPLRDLSGKIKAITAENLDTRLAPGAVPIELQQLVLSFNQMLARIEDVFTRQANFSADIAHEMRTPITNLITQSEIVLSQPRTQNELEEVIYSNLEEYQRMAKMVNDMLFLAQADSQRLRLSRVPLDLRQETLKVFDFFEAWAEERQVTLRVDGEGPAAWGDPSMLRRVISNLLSNAIRHTPAGHSVTVRLSGTADEVRLCVANPGTPIASRHLARLFDRFYRVDPARQRNGEGSGIGLAIVKSIIGAHQGQIWVSSDPDATRFTFSLPRAPESGNTPGCKK